VNTGSYAAARDIMDVTGGLVNIVYLGTLASLFGFSREQETQADELGLKRAAAAGYSPSAGVNVWTALREENAASEFGKVRRREARVNIFGSHPLSGERLQTLGAVAAGLPTGGDFGRERHRAAIRPHLAAWLKDDLRRRDFGQTLTVIDNLAEGGEDLGVLNFYRGETYRVRGKPGDPEQALKAYAAASGHADAPVAVWRELGDLRRKAGDRAGARTAYESYLAKAAGAEDAWLVQDALKGLGES
jgi:predicted Zn-dependent protease